MHIIRKIRIHIGLLSLLLLLAQCGGKGTTACAPNFNGQGLSILMTRLPGGINQYEITICDSFRTNNNDISVYGVLDESDIPTMSLATRVRAPHIQDSSNPGDTFYVTFQNNDTFFIIYEDDAFGGYSSNVELVRGELFH